MSSSLAAQLAGIKANNNATILDKSKRRTIHSVSLVYEPKEAAAQDFESIYYGCVEALRELESVDRRFGTFANSLFSETSIRFDRMVQNSEQALALNTTIDRFLMLVAGYLNLQPAFRALEWLVRRFHVHLHNAESLLMAALPWHSSEEFVRILDIVPANQLPPIFGFLGSSKQNLQGPSQTGLVRVLSRDDQLFEAVNSFVLRSVHQGVAYSRQLVFWSGINICLCMVFKEKNDSDIVDKLLPVLAEVLPQSKRPAAQIAAYMVLSVVCSQFSLNDGIVDATVSTISANLHHSRRQALACVAQLVRFASPEYAVQPFSSTQWRNMAPDSSEVVQLARTHSAGAGRFVIKWAISVAEHAPEQLGDVAEVLRSNSSRPNAAQLDAVVNYVFTLIKTKAPFEPKLNEILVKFVETALSLLPEPPTAEMDRLELALQTSVSRPDKQEATSAMEGVEKEETLAPAAESEGPTRAEIEDKASNMEQSSASSFLDEPLGATERVKLWIQAAACPDIPRGELVSIARVAPGAEMSFLMAVALGPWPTLCRVVAIKTFADLLEASEDSWQIYVVHLLYLLSDSDQRIRQEAAEAVRKLPKKTSKDHKPETSADIKWLPRAQAVGVYERLVGNLEECILDHDHVFALCRQAGKLAWSEFLVSVALNTKLPQILWITLRALSSFKGVVKQLAPLYEFWNQPQTRRVWQERCDVSRFNINTLEAALVGTMRSNESVGVKFAQTALKRGGTVAEAAASHIVTVWKDNVFKGDTREKLLDTLLDIAADESVDYDPENALAQLLPLSTDVFASLLERAKLSRETSSATAADSNKRRRRSSSSLQFKGASSEMMSFAERHLRKVTLVLELLERSTANLVLEEDASRLFGALFDILEELMSLGADSNLPVLYTEELLASCMIQLVENLKAHSHSQKIDTSAIRVNLIVSCIRTSTSPQVQNRLLLLVAALATVCPDVVLHSVMPIFTFMGATTVRLDNDYSAHVIQQTIAQVVPALVACGDKHEEIEMALMSFVAAFSHIPRHRRIKLFGALIRTLGPQNSLYKLLLLLGERYGEAALMQKGRGQDALVHFTTTFLRSFSVQDQLAALEKYVRFAVEDLGEGEERFGLLKIKEAIHEAPRLRGLLIEFMVLTGGNDQQISGTQPLRAQISGSDVELRLVGAMIEMLVRVSKDENVKSAGDLLAKCLELLPIDKFVTAVTPLLSGQDSILELVDRKFGYERTEDSVAVAAATDMVLQLQNRGNMTPAALDTLDQLVIKFGRIDAQNMMSLLNVLVGPQGLKCDDIDVVVASVGCINSLCQHLGARMIGYFPRILPVLFARAGDVDAPESLQLATFALIGGLVQRIPSFMTPVIKQTLELVFAARGVAVAPRRRLLELLADKVEAQAVIGVYSTDGVWDSAVRGGMPSIDLFFASLDAVVIDKASKRDVAAKAGALAHLMTTWFGSRASARFSPNEINQIEGRATTTAMNIVLKLNDRVFRPLFVQIVRWGFDAEAAETAAVAARSLRLVPVLKFVCRIISTLKSIVTGYFGYIIDNVCDDILGVRPTSDVDAHVRKLVYQALTLSFQSDQDDFWQSPSRFDKILEVLLAQLSGLDEAHGALVVKAITALAESSASQQHRKKINDDLSVLLAAEDASSTQKIWAVRVLSSLYTKLGEDWIANLPQLVPLIAELLDDEDEGVENETRRSLVPVIEDVLGESLDRYLA